jgi:hypothetical protein
MIRISHVFPPIPDRRFDYCAYIGDGDEGTLQGWGATPKEALEDLSRVCWEHDLDDERNLVEDELIEERPGAIDHEVKF